MERFLSAAMAGLWTGTIAGFGVAYWIWANPSKSSGKITGAEKAMGEGLAIFGGGVLSGLFVLAAVTILVWRFLPSDPLRTIQIVSAMMILALVGVGAVLMNREEPQKYAAYVGILDIEVRVPKAMWDRERLGNGLVVGTSNFLPPDYGYGGKAAEENGYMVKSVSMRIPEKHQWTATVTANGIDQVWFKLGWPDHPAEAIDWTEWMEPTEKAGPRSEGIRVRCRWRLVPFGSELSVERFF